MKRFLFVSLLVTLSLIAKSQNPATDNHKQETGDIVSGQTKEYVNFNPQGEKSIRNLPYYQYKGIRDWEEARILWERENPEAALKYYSEKKRNEVNQFNPNTSNKSVKK